MTPTKKKYLLTLGCDCDLYDILAVGDQPKHYNCKKGDKFIVVAMGETHLGERYAVVISKWRPGVKALHGQIMFNELHKMEEAVI